MRTEVEIRSRILSTQPTQEMKTKLAFLAARSLGSVALFAEETTKMEKFMITGSLAEPPGSTQKLEKFLVTGSMAKAAKTAKKDAHGLK